MKKFITMVLVTLMIIFGANALANEIDLSAMTEEELRSLIEKAQNELQKFDTEETEDATKILAINDILFEDEYVRITYSDAINIDQMFGWLNIPIIVENLTDSNLYVTVSNVSCNGWAVFDASTEVPAGKKARAEFCFMDAVENAELTAVEDVKDIEGDVYCMNSDTFDMTEAKPIKWVFAE